MPFGGQTITFTNRAAVRTGAPDALGHYPLNDGNIDAPGCRHRPLTFKETAEMQFDVGTEFWRSTIPIGEYLRNPETISIYTAVVDARTNDVITVAGITYEIIAGSRPHPDLGGTPFKATIISKKYTG